MSGKSAARVTDPIALCLMRSTRKPADMKKLLAILLIVFCASCAKDHSVPAANLNFLNVEREGNSSLYALLSQRKSVPCKVVVTAYGYKPYYSNTMNIPTADLLREINKPE